MIVAMAPRPCLRVPSLRRTLLAAVASVGLASAQPVEAQQQPGLAEAPETGPAAAVPGDQTVTASELQAAIDAIKRRVAEQQEARDTTGGSELAVELRAARAAITELTQNLMRLRSERDALQADLDARRATETALRAELGSRIDATAALEVALAEAEDRASRAEQQASEAARILAAAAESAAAEAAEQAAALASSQAETAAVLDQLRDSEGDLAAAEDRLAALEGELESANLAAADRSAALATEALARSTAEVARERAASELAAAEARLADREVTLADLEATLADVAAERLVLEGRLDESEAARSAALEQVALAEQARAALDARVSELAAEQSAALAAAERRESALAAELADLRDVASRSVAEVETLGETLLATLADNEDLTLALSEVRTTRSALEVELAAMRRDLETYTATADGPPGDDMSFVPFALVASDAVVEAMDAELSELRRQIAALSEELIARDKQLVAASVEGDADALTQRLGLLQREVASLTAENEAMASSLATLRARADLAAPELITASLAPDEAVEHFLGQLNAVDTGDGWWMTVPDGLVFAPGSNELAPGTEAVVAQIAALVSYFGDAPVRIVGHTDSFGDASVNRELSLARAETVARLLVDRFEVDAARIATEGFGEEQPIASNATIEGRRTNRRVEVYVQR